MSCEIFKEKFADYVRGMLEAETVGEIEAHLTGCPSCREEMARLAGTWEELQNLPDHEPGPAVRSRFYSMLEDEKRATRRSTRTLPAVPWQERADRWVSSWWPRRPAVQLVASVTLLLIGLFIGFRTRPPEAAGGDIARLRSEVRQMRETMTIALLDRPTAGERLRGVSMSTEVEQPDRPLVDALFDALDTDPSTNVRIAVVDALALLADRADVRERMIASLQEQTSAMVQISLIDLLVQMREEKVLRALRSLIEDQQIDRSIRQHAEEGLKTMI